MGEVEDYRFLEIRDAIVAINQKVNLIAVVIEFGLPRKTRGTDCFCSLKIIDQSHPKPGISVNVFTENLERLPRVASAGDIILLTHVVMKIHHGEANAVFNKKFSSFALYEGKDGNVFCPYQVSPKFRPRDVDKKFIASLRKWLGGLKIDEGSSNFSLMSNIKKGEHVNLVCKIIHVCEVAKDEWMSFVWDGTDVCPVDMDQRLHDSRLSSNPKWRKIPKWSFPWMSHITEIDYEEVPIVTLMDILTHSEVTAKFKCVVRVVAALPWQASEFRCSSGSYRIRLTLEDPTARIYAYLYAEDGEKFFDGYPSLDELRRKRDALLGIAESENGQEVKDTVRKPPWVQCCLKSYYLTKSDIWGSRHYRIFGTKLVLD